MPEFTGNPLYVVIMMRLIQLLLGIFMPPSIVVLTVEVYFPIIQELGLSPLWFSVVMLLNMQIETTFPHLASDYLS